MYKNVSNFNVALYEHSIKKALNRSTIFIDFN